MKNWQDLKIGTRLGILLGTILLSVIVFVGLGMVWFTNLNSEMTSSIQQRYKTVELTHKAIENSITNARITMQLFDTTDPQEVIDLNRQNDAISQDIGVQVAAIQKTLSSPRERDLFAAVGHDRELYKSARQKAKDLLAANQRDQALAVLREEVIPALNLYRLSWDQFIDLQTAAMQDSLQRSHASYALAASIAWLLLIVSLILAPFAVMRVTKGITVPIRQAVEQAERIAIGDLNQNIQTHRQDELGELGPALANMVQYLKEMADVSEAIARGELYVQVQPHSDRDTLGNAFKNMIEGLRDIVSSVRGAASQVAAGSTQVAEASERSAELGSHAFSAIEQVTSTMHEMSVNVQHMVKNTQMQGSSVNETSSSIDQMVASIQRVAETARVLLDISNRSREEVQSGIATMQKTTEGLNRINRSIGSSATIISSLGESADNIGKIVEVIDDISEQTNLLALNAAIEAARAGEHGLGFAVVADEVRKLAEKSAVSTKEIGELIGNIQKQARRAVEDMEKSTTIVNEGLELGNDLNLALRKISNVVTEVYKFAQEIGAATNEQSNGSSQIAKATERLHEITHEINSAVEEQAGGAQAVVRSMERLREMVDQSSSSFTELAASAEQMSRMASHLLESMDRFAIDDERRLTESPTATRPKALAARAGAKRT